MLPLLAAGAAGSGLLGKALGFGAKSGVDVGNPFGMSDDERAKAKKSGQDLLNYQGSADALDPIQSSRTATSEVDNNAILGGLYGQDSALSRALSEEQDLASRGYGLQQQDHEAYGQASGNIARQFGQAETGLAEALSSRGMSGSGAANQAFMSSQGNKMEQLAGLQTKIANDRMKSNMDRLAQTRNFVQGLGAQGANAIQDQYGRQLSSENARFGQQESKANMGQRMLGNEAQQGMNQAMISNATRQKGLGEALTSGVVGLAQAAPGLAAKGAIGGA